jgi:hypothetical protein
MTMEDKRQQSKINVVKKKMKRFRKDNALRPYVDIKENPEFVLKSEPTKTIWDWIKEKFW